MQVIIAGRLSSNTRQTGKIFINGHKETLAFGTSVCEKHVFIVLELRCVKKGRVICAYCVYAYEL